MEETKKAYERLKNAIDEYQLLQKLPIDENFEGDLYDNIAKAEQNFYAAMSDDFNTPEALASIFGLVREMNILKDKAVKNEGISKKALESYKEAAESIHKLGRDIFGFFDSLQPCIKTEEIKTEKKEEGKVDEELVETLLEVREKARKEKQFALADLIRDKLAKLGIIIEDTPVGTKWKKM
jgi:cysteinyl-tRNA synthetase